MAAVGPFAVELVPAPRVDQWADVTVCCASSAAAMFVFDRGQGLSWTVRVPANGSHSSTFPSSEGSAVSVSVTGQGSHSVDVSYSLHTR